jgi:cellulose synthase/poly-beta-1,6-N-acetylglucosamine synthase-like glycosyltransferase
MVLVYWASLLALVHTWGLYGLWLFAWRALRPRPQLTAARESVLSITFIVAAHNEERSIRARLENLRILACCEGSVEVLVASDGTDRTGDVVREFQKAWGAVQLLEFPVRRGRAAVHNETAGSASGEILVFTDAETRFDPHFLDHILPHFQDPRVAAVSGRICYINEQDSSITRSAGLYWRLEERLRSWESDLGLLAFGTGAAFCMRRDLYTPMPSAHDDVDYWETLSLVGRGYRLQYEPRALAFDTLSPEVETTHRVRVRKTAMAFRSMLQGIRAFRLWERPGILFSILSHKLLRHVSPALLLSLLFSNGALWSSGDWYRCTMILQALFYTLALLGGLGHALGWTWKPLVIPFNFVLLNYSRMLGLATGLIRKPPPTYR